MKLKIIKMLEYDTIDISEGIDINKCEETSRKCSLYKFYYFLDLIMDHIYVMVVMICL